MSRRSLTTLLIALLAAVVVGAAVIVGAVLVAPDAPKPFDPLRYPDSLTGGQRVTSRVHGIDGPAVRIGEPVHVVGAACNVSSKPVAIVSRTFWSVARPLGLNLLTSQGAALRKPGCQTFDYENPMPRSVMEAARIRPRSLWRINGHVTPTNPNGVTRYWQTQEFRIVP